MRASAAAPRAFGRNERRETARRFAEFLTRFCLGKFTGEQARVNSSLPRRFFAHGIRAGNFSDRRHHSLASLGQDFRLFVQVRTAASAPAAPFTGWTLLPLPLQPPGATVSGISVPLLGADSGDLSFQALLESAQHGDETVKRLAAVRVDPLRPLDPRRTSIVPLGPRYRLTATPDGGHVLAPAGAAG